MFRNLKWFVGLVIFWTVMSYGYYLGFVQGNENVVNIIVFSWWIGSIFLIVGILSAFTFFDEIIKKVDLTLKDWWIIKIIQRVMFILTTVIFAYYGYLWLAFFCYDCNNSIAYS